MDFFYDASGYPFAVKYNGDLCYYITNLQGDVMSIVDAQGEVVAEYEYDPYGNILTATGPLADVNPLRYRGYVFDSETQFYYLQSRYYDPELGRFLNADSYASTGQGVLGNNMFAYCTNNPVNLADPTGEIAITTLIFIGSVIFGAANAAYTAYVEYNLGCDIFQIIGDSLFAGMSAFCFIYSMGMTAYQYYQNYCYLNGLTPVTNIGQTTTTTQNAANPLESITYTDKVKQQRQQGDYHGFPDIVDNYGAYGSQNTIIGGDGNTYTKLCIPGTYDGKDGYFVYIWDGGNVCNHRLFETK